MAFFGGASLTTMVIAVCSEESSHRLVGYILVLFTSMIGLFDGLVDMSIVDAIRGGGRLFPPGNDDDEDDIDGLGE